MAVTDVDPSVLRFGSGHVVLDPGTGALLRFVDEQDPARRFLLEAETTDWHSVEHQWGSGHLVTERGAARWYTPARLRIEEDGAEAVYTPLPGLRVEVHRSVRGRTLHERYAVVNIASEPVTITALGIQTPFADLYDGAERSLQHAVHAHLFTGGTWAWALAQPMSGRGRVLGVIVREGALRAYAVESRNVNSMSNARGHLVLLVTDHARNPGAFGGQPPIVLQPGQSTAVSWELGWYATACTPWTWTTGPVPRSSSTCRCGRSCGGGRRTSWSTRWPASAPACSPTPSCPSTPAPG
ncbi:hypothetical protein GCM10023080_053960 [Streptomyces pseudoechinosporeus]